MDDALAPPGPDRGLTTAELSRWVDRAVAIMCLSALIPTLTLAQAQLQSLHLGWLLVVAGAIAASSALMPLYAWSDRGMRLPALLFALAVLTGLLSWPAAWLGSSPPTQEPWLWMSLIVSTASTAIVFGNRIGIVYLAVCALSYLFLRTMPSGGAVSWLVAAEDTLLAVAQPAAIVACLYYARRAVRDLDVSLARTHTEQAEAAVKEALVAERGRLDAIVHDEVMTTLVAAARTTGPHEEPVTQQARAALTSLAAAEGEAGVTAPLAPDQFQWLVADLVASVAPTASFTADVSPHAGLLPQEPVVALAQATREACLNASRHADATQIAVELRVALVDGRPDVAIVITDDGTGFDPASVATERLGIRLSLYERMRLVGGRADLHSAPGEGTRVALTWSGTQVDPVTRARVARRLDFWDHPIFVDQNVAPYAYATGALMSVYTLVGWLSWPLYERPWLAAIGLVAVGVATGVGLARMGSQMSTPRALFIEAAALGATVLTLLAIPAGAWDTHTIWFPGAFCLLSVTVRAGNQPIVAWVSACLYGMVVLLAAAFTDEDFIATLGTALAPLVWLGLLEFFIDWLARVYGQLLDNESHTERSAAANAVAFSKLVLREVWLADVRGQVGELLDKLADPAQPLTDADRELCLVTEGTLRDNIKAHNLTSPSLAAAIVAARRRGVQVTLVDNRGSVLPDGVRRATLRHLEAVVRTMAAGRLVARTAPEGYAEAVTIVAVDMGGAATMTTIDNDGTIAVKT